ncbi:hypothetical protein CDAR_407281 [Caerostris darwini]|uniref:Uncharacterized protein n=1 Tax=Caerostris darwini TaxID=1538125 RepID=A0AAV4Q689_9ARAC|nr:hypothetical protein CDAR_407281 [Caerostris darwini]
MISFDSLNCYTEETKKDLFAEEHRWVIARRSRATWRLPSNLTWRRERKKKIITGSRGLHLLLLELVLSLFIRGMTHGWQRTRWQSTRQHGNPTSEKSRWALTQAAEDNGMVQG